MEVIKSKYHGKYYATITKEEVEKSLKKISELTNQGNGKKPKVIFAPYLPLTRKENRNGEIS